MAQKAGGRDAADKLSEKYILKLAQYRKAASFSAARSLLSFDFFPFIFLTFSVRQSFNSCSLRRRVLSVQEILKVNFEVV